MVRRISDRKRKLNVRAVSALITAVLLAGLVVMGVFAQEADRMPDLDAGAEGTLKVQMTYTDPNLEKDNVKPMPEVEIRLAQVARLQVEGGSAEYTLLDAYRETGIRLAGMTAAESNEAAQKLAGLVDAGSGSSAVSGSGTTGSNSGASGNVSGTPSGSVLTRKTDADGRTVFENLEPGMYLVFQSAGANTAYRVDATAAFLVAVPYPVQSEDGNGWQYEVEVKPKTELAGPKNNGVVRVTKQLVNRENQLAYYPPEDQELIFYVGLFTDEACTVRAEGTADQPLRFHNSSAATAVFENLTTDRTYYIAETDGKGTVIGAAEKGEVLFEAEYPAGQAVPITRNAPEGTAAFRNVTNGVPIGYYYGGTLTVTKKTLMDGAEYKTGDVFYAGLFTDEKLRNRYGDVITLDLDGKSSVSVPLEVSIGRSENDSVTYYVAETDEDGNPLDDSREAFTISLNKENGKVTLTPASPNDEVVITNRFTKERQDGGSSNSETGRSGGSQVVRTGDETPIAIYAVLFVAAAAVLLILLGSRRKYRRK